MSDQSVFDLLFVAAAFACVAWWLRSRCQYLLLRLKSRNWPSARATIQRGPFGRVSRGRFSIPAAFLGYAFSVEGARHAGLFVLYGDELKLCNAVDRIVGETLEIRYKPANPDFSCVADFRDPAFVNVKLTQDPEWLDQAPAFDLADSLRGGQKR